MDDSRLERTRDFERFVTFIDAIVAIAITLLVLPLVELGNELADRTVIELLGEHVGELGAFVLSFLVISALWLAQHHILRGVIAHSVAVTRLLLLWTLTIVVLPFPTSLLSEAGDQAATKLLYVGTLTVNAVLLALLAWAVGRDRSVRDSDERPRLTPSISTAVAFGVALVISLVFPSTSYYPLLLLILPQPLILAWQRLRRPA